MKHPDWRGGVRRTPMRFGVRKKIFLDFLGFSGFPTLIPVGGEGGAIVRMHQMTALVSRSLHGRATRERIKREQHHEGARGRDRATKLHPGTTLLDSARGPAGAASRFA